jgi:predicted NUDIX family NTP pyrophosphohydrolase
MSDEWTSGSGRRPTVPAADRCAWLDPPTARDKLKPAHAEVVDRLEAAIAPD